MFATQYMHRGTNLASLVGTLLRPTLDDWRKQGLIKFNLSFGLAVAHPASTLEDPNYSRIWDDPNKLIAFVVGWGPERAKYIDNAAGKVRAAARTGLDTVWIAKNDPNRFMEGDFPYGGAAYTLDQLVGVSALTADEDDWVARMVGGFLFTEMNKLDAKATASTGA